MNLRLTFATLLAALTIAAAADASTTVTLRNSRLTFQQALAACPGALGAVTFSLGHTRSAGQAGVLSTTEIAGSSGVSQDGSTSKTGVETLIFLRVSDDKSARVVADPHAQSVKGNHVTSASRGLVACVAPD